MRFSLSPTSASRLFRLSLRFWLLMDPLGERILGEAAYDQFRIWFFAMQPLVLLVSLVGYLKMVRWILRCHSAQSSNQALQPIAGRSDV